jgi:UDP-N-acetylmuramate dehydrogenase
MDITFPEDLNLDIIPGALLSDITTFRLGGRCQALIMCTTSLQLEEVIKRFILKKAPYIIIGGGSNLLVSDKGIDSYVIRFLTDSPLLQRQGNEIIAKASARFDDLVAFAAHEGLLGLNCFSGIPGTIAGAIVGNAGAFGEQISDKLYSIKVIERKTGFRKTYLKDDLKFSYRDSLLKTTGDIVLSARFQLTVSETSKVEKERQAFLDLRKDKHPDWKDIPSAGCVFRNIENPLSHKRQSAGWFLEQAGAKGLKVGGAAVFEKHANIVINQDPSSCRAQHVYDLAQIMAQKVFEKFGINLIREIRFVGDFECASQSVHPLIW